MQQSNCIIMVRQPQNEFVWPYVNAEAKYRRLEIIIIVIR